MFICMEPCANNLHINPAGATATPSSCASLKARMVSPFWCQFTQVVLEKRPLNRSLCGTGRHFVCPCLWEDRVRG